MERQSTDTKTYFHTSFLLPNPRSTALLWNARQKLRFVSVAAELQKFVPGQSPRDEKWKDSPQDER